MFTQKDFEQRASNLYDNDIKRWRARLQAQAPRGVTLEIPASQVLPYTRTQHRMWLWNAMGCSLGAFQCTYCNAPIDLISMVVDHKTPIRRGGSPDLDNQCLCCDRCNKVKGEFTEMEFRILLAFMEGPGLLFRARLEGVLINGGVGKMMRLFPKKKGEVKKRYGTQPRLPEFAEEMEKF